MDNDPWKALMDAPKYESDDDIIIKKKEKAPKMDKPKKEKKRLDEQKPVDPLLVLAGMVHVDDDNEMMRMGSPVQTMPDPVVEDDPIEKEITSLGAKKEEKVKETVVHTIEEPEIKERKTPLKDDFLVVSVPNITQKHEMLKMVMASVCIPYAKISEISETIVESDTNLLIDARLEACNKMVQEAKKIGANGVINVTYQITDLMGEFVEVISTGTAVYIK